MPKYTKPRGTKDLFGTQMDIMQYIKAVSKEVLESYDFSLIGLPTFESTSLYTRSVGTSSDIVQKEMYTFLDKSERSLTLRPEGTAGCVRAYIENGMNLTNTLPLKLYYDLNAFRYEKVQSGRQREFTQIGAEIFGAKSALADAENIICVMKIMEKLGILDDVELRINCIGNEVSREKYKKLLLDYVNTNEKEYCEDCLRRKEENVLRVLDCKEEKCKALNAKIPKIYDYLEKEDQEFFQEVLTYLDSNDVAKNYVKDQYLVRGLDYYNLVVFEIIDKKTQKAIAGGGRYDSLVKELGGADTPSLGFALGVDRIRQTIEDKFKDNMPFDSKIVDFCIISGYNEKNNEMVLKVSEILRDKGYCVVTNISGKSFNAQIKYADKIGAKKGIIVEEDGTFRLKDFANRTQEDVSFADICNFRKEGK